MVWVLSNGVGAIKWCGCYQMKWVPSNELDARVTWAAAVRFTYSWLISVFLVMYNIIRNTQSFASVH